MKQKLLKMTLLLCALIVGSSVWADTYSLTPNQSNTGSSATAYITTLTEFTYSGISWKMNQWNPKTLQVKTNQSSAASEFRFYNTSAFPGKITQVVVTFSALTVSNSSGFMFVGGTSEVNTTSGGTSGTWDSETKTITWTPDASDNYTYFAFYQNGKVASGSNYLAETNAIVVTYENSSTPTCATPTFSPAAGTYTSAQSVEINTTTEGATIYYTTDGTNPTTTSTEYAEPISVSTTTTIKAFAVADGYENSSVATATYTIVSLEHAGTEADPYTVADARTAIDADAGITGVYATGVVSKIVTAYNDTYENITFDISVDGATETAQLRAYRCVGATGIDASDVQVGDVVIVSGDLTKYGDIYEFAQGCQLVSLQHPVVTTPTITVNPTSLTDFTYLVGNGPSAAQKITFSGSNLTAGITASLGDNSDFEFSFSEDGEYFSNNIAINADMTLSVYVRMKSGLAAGEYSGTITLTSEGAETVTVALSGSVTAPEAPNVTWDLSTDSYDEITDPDIVTWSSTYATMTNSSKSGDTSASNYLGGDSNNRTSSRFYSGNTLIITPGLGYMITSIEFVATSTSYASALQGSTWTNATASVDNTTVTVTPTNGSSDISAVIGGTCGFTSVKVYYQELSDFAPIWSALPSPTITAGETYEIDLNTYVTAMPAPSSITLETSAPNNSYDYDNGYFLFSSDVAGEYTFTFTATNSEGSASATLTITVEAAVASIDLSTTSIDAPYAGLDGTIDVIYNNLTNVLAEVQFVEADGTTPATYSWVVADINNENNIEYVIEENTSTDARTAYMKVYAIGNEGDAYSDLITITQTGVVVDYATLPFKFDGGRADIETTNGLSQEGLDSDYGSSPKLKFNNTDDWVILKFNERPGTLTFDIKGNSFSGGTFTVQTSEDGTNYTDLETYTELSSTLNESFNNLGENVRYIKWIYTEKVSGNVALGNIRLAAYSAPSLDPVITVDPDEVSVDADEHDGTLAITYANLTISNMTDFSIQYYDENGEEATKPDWIEVLVAEQDPSIGEGYVVSYYMMENDGAARTAYCKVFAMNDKDFVYSNLVTITQAAYVAPATGDQYALFSGNLVEGDYIIYYDGKAMNTTTESNRLQFAEITPTDDVITTDNAAIVWHIAKSGDYWTIYNAAESLYAASTGTKNQATVDNETSDKTLWTVSGTETYEFVNKNNAANSVNANLRNNGTYGFACYSTTTGGALSLYKKILPVTSTSLTLNAYGYATFASTEALDFSNYATADYSAWQITSVNTSTGVITFEQIKQAVAPGTGLLLKGTPSETITLNTLSEGGTTLASNLLEGVTEPKTIADDEYLGLSGDKFVPVKAGTIPAGKALLPIPGGGVKAYNFVFEDDPDGIKTMDNGQWTMDNAAIYNLAGQRIDNSQFTIHNSQLKRGIYIVNGKKILK